MKAVLGLKKLLFFTGIVVFFPIKLIYRFSLKTILTGLYQQYFNIKKKVIQISHPNVSKLLTLFSSKYVLHAIIVIITLAVTAGSLSAQTIVQDEYGKKSILNSVVQKAEYEVEYIETAETAIIQSSHYFKNLGAVAAANPKLVEETELLDLTSTATGGGSIVKPTLATTIQGARPRESVEYYIVQGGDTISTIAQKFGISSNTILWENELTFSSLIRPGNELTILPVTGVSYRVKSGDTVDSIANKYKADSGKILDYNKLASADSIREGEVLVIPDGKIDPPAPAPTTYASAPIYAGSIPDSAALSGGNLQWPTPSHKINQYYSWRHHGLDIDGTYSSPIYAAENGTVVANGWGTGYGQHVTINHGGGLKTLYAHLSKIYVSNGEAVARGQTIGMMGCTGWCTGTHLHFEVFINGAKQNPLSYL
ncbi:M23 family metallopeptidase [Patescibacteria group bacterium]|nr:M23 family metallopeptidase [Patescibacteria group bacterium]